LKAGAGYAVGSIAGGLGCTPYVIFRNISDDAIIVVIRGSEIASHDVSSDKSDSRKAEGSQ